jgi:hypothetical protein
MQRRPSRRVELPLSRLPTSERGPEFWGEVQPPASLSGGAYSPIVAFPKVSVQLAGEPRYHKVVGKNGKAIERGFCQSCGSQVTMKWERLADFFGLQAGCLDDPSLYKPAMDVFTASAQPWDHMDPNVQKHVGAPPI